MMEEHRDGEGLTPDGPASERSVDERASVDEQSDAPPGGWRSQSPLLKTLLLVSLVAIVAGVVRCATEMTQPRGDGEVVGMTETESR